MNWRSSAAAVTASPVLTPTRTWSSAPPSRISSAPVLLVPADQQIYCALRFGLVAEYSRRAFDPHPPELAPVLLVMVEQHGDRRVGRDVAQALKVGRALGLCVDREIDALPFDRKGDRDDVWSSPRSSRRQAGDARVGNTPSHNRRVHRTKYR